jgi:hypothetical protein
MNLTLRDLENCIALYSISNPDSGQNSFNSYCLAVPIAIKVKYPNIFQRMMDYEKKAFATVVELLKEVIANMDGKNVVVIDAWATYLEALGPSSLALANLQNDSMPTVVTFLRALSIIKPAPDSQVEPREVFQHYARRIDLDIY